jgi:hypothetical protein
MDYTMIDFMAVCLISAMGLFEPVTYSALCIRSASPLITDSLL